MDFQITFFTAVLLLVSASTSIGQTKVGSGDDFFLEFSSSARANAMGDAGVALIDGNSAWYNPASMGLYHLDHRAQMTFHPVSTDEQSILHYRYYSFSARVFDANITEGIPFAVAVGYFRTRASSDPIPITTYGNPAGTGEYFTVLENAHDFILALSMSKFLDFGAGFSYSHVNKEVADVLSEGHTFDLGVIVRLPSDRIFAPPATDGNIVPFFSPAVGFSWCNIDSRITINTIEYPIDEFKRVGIGAPVGLRRFSRGLSYSPIMITPSFEIKVLNDRDDQYRYGVELELMEAVAGRLGKLESILGASEYTADTWGIGLNSRGIIRFISDLAAPRPAASYGPVMKFLREDLAVRFSFARKSMPEILNYVRFGDFDYYEISIEL